MPNPTNESRLARAVVAAPQAGGLSYQQALDAVRCAAQAGALPDGRTRPTPAAVKAVLRHLDPHRYVVSLGHDESGVEVGIPMFDLRKHVHLAGDAPERDAMVTHLLHETGAVLYPRQPVPAPRLTTPLEQLVGTADPGAQQTILSQLVTVEDQYWNAVLGHVTAKAVAGNNPTYGSALKALRDTANDPKEYTDVRKVAELAEYRLSQLTVPGHRCLDDLADSVAVVAAQTSPEEKRRPWILRLALRDTATSQTAVRYALSRGRAAGVIVVVESDLGGELLTPQMYVNVNLRMRQTAHGWEVRAHHPDLSARVQPDRLADVEPPTSGRTLAGTPG